MILTGKGGIKYNLEAAPFAQGGEGQIFNIIGQLDKVAKLYKPGKITAEHERKLIKMITTPPSQDVLSQIAWPLDTLYDNGQFVGFVMNKFKLNEDLNVIYEYGSSAKYPYLTWGNKIRIAKNLCVVLHAVHEAGHVCGDFNPKNISVDPNTGHVIFVDTDSYHIMDGTNTYRCNVGMPEYLPREIQVKMKNGLANATLPTFGQATDNFALAVHIFQLLMNGVHPFACAIIPSAASVVMPDTSESIINGECPFFVSVPGKQIPKFAPPVDILPDDIKKLFQLAFVTGHKSPTERPSAETWYYALENLEKSLTKCAKEPHHEYYDALTDCPWCAADARFNSAVTTAAKQMQQSAYTPITPPPSAVINVGSNYSSVGNNYSSGGGNSGNNYTTQSGKKVRRSKIKRKKKPFTFGRLVRWALLIGFIIHIGPLIFLGVSGEIWGEEMWAKRWERSAEWDQVGIEDRAIQIADVFAVPGVKVSEFLEKIEKSEVRWKNNIPKNCVVPPYSDYRIKFKKGWFFSFEVIAVNVSNSELPISECIVAVIDFDPNFMSRHIDGTYTLDFKKLSYEQVLDLQYNLFKDVATIGNVEEDCIEYKLNSTRIGDTGEWAYRTLDSEVIYQFDFYNKEPRGIDILHGGIDYEKTESSYIDSINDLDKNMLDIIEQRVNEKAMIELKTSVRIVELCKQYMKANKDEGNSLLQLYEAEINGEKRYLETVYRGLELDQTGLSVNYTVEILNSYGQVSEIKGWDNISTKLDSDSVQNGVLLEIIAGVANIREGASTKYEILMTVNKGTVFEATGNHQVASNGSTWYEIYLDDEKTRTGWVNETLIEIKNNKS